MEHPRTERNITNPDERLWYEAAYLYYLHPEHGELLPDAVWDQLGRKLGKPGSAFHLREEDYPEDIRVKYRSER